MKKSIYILLTSITIFSCNENKISTENGYSNKLDTTYKDNSTDIESITRTFYFKGDDGLLSDYFSLSQKVGEKDYIIAIREGEEFGGIVLNDKGFKSLIENARIIMKNKNKDLTFDISEFKTSSMSHAAGMDSGITINSQNLSGKSVSYQLSNTDIDNLEKAYQKYITEK